MLASILERALASSLTLALVAACGGDSGDASSAGSRPSADGDESTAQDEDPGGGSRTDRGTRGKRSSKGRAHVEVVDAGSAAAGTPGVLSGVVVFDGEPPKRVPITPIANTSGCDHHHETTPLSENAIVTEGKLQNVVVAIRAMPDGYAAPAPPDEPWIIDQLGCLFVPHVSAVQVGRRVHARNSDPTPHNVRATGTLFEGLNRTIAKGGAPIEMVFEGAEPIRMACDIHPWMSGHVLVFEHPFFAVTGADGAFRIEGVPAGEYELEAWHEKFGKVRSERFALGPGGEVSVSWTYAP